MIEEHNSPRQFEIDFEPVGRRIPIVEGDTLLGAAQSAGVEMVSICGGVGICEGCRLLPCAFLRWCR